MISLFFVIFVISCPVLVMGSIVCGSERFDTAPIHPFCGPNTTELVCQQFNQVRSSFGPRLLASDQLRYDFHRGIDINAPIGTPLYAVADGLVNKAGDDPSYSDPVVVLRHYRPGCTSCATHGCYYSAYLHVHNATVSKDQTVTKGQLVGYSGESQSGYAHLHFEIRDAPPEDPYSSWQRDCVHPLEFLPYPDNGIANIAVSADGPPQLRAAPDGAALASANFSVNFNFSAIHDREMDWAGFRVRVLVNGQEIRQPGDVNRTVKHGSTVEGDGYLVAPFSEWKTSILNRQYTYKNSASIPFSSFQCGGQYESPFCELLANRSYSPNIHLDRAIEEDQQLGCFNGWCFKPDGPSVRKLLIQINDLSAGSDINDNDKVCVQLQVFDVKNQSTPFYPQDCNSVSVSTTTTTTSDSTFSLSTTLSSSFSSSSSSFSSSSEQQQSSVDSKQNQTSISQQQEQQQQQQTSTSNDDPLDNAASSSFIISHLRILFTIFLLFYLLLL